MALVATSIVVVAVIIGILTYSPYYSISPTGTTMSAIIGPSPGILEMQEVDIPTPKYGQLLIKVAYAPVNPSDVYYALGEYNLPGATKDYPISVGLEGSGVVVGSGGGPLSHLYAALETRVGFATFGYVYSRNKLAIVASHVCRSWSEYVVINSLDVIPLPSDVTLLQGSSPCVNPLTTVSLLEVAKSGGHTALVNTAASSSLGLMLLRASKAYNITVICVVRGEKNANKILEVQPDIDRKLIIRSDLPDFATTLESVVAEVKATIAYDCVNGELASTIYDAMPDVSEVYNYGSLSGQETPGQLLAKSDDAKKPFKHFHLKAYLDDGGILTKLKIVSIARPMLASELATDVAQEIPFNSEEALGYIHEYYKHQTSGKVVLKM
eukprot:m.22103 g.22103  ORF g.22103 m.22103 type:complete len:382 (-) comp7339_c0_seq1:623-1768(-)